MDYFGWTLSKNLFLGQLRDLAATGMQHLNGNDFEPNQTFWNALFAQHMNIMQNSGLDQQMGSVFHLTNGAGELIVNLGYVHEYKKFVEGHRFPNGFTLGLHCAHQDKQVLGSKDFIRTLKTDLNIGRQLGISALVEHPPIGTRDTTKEAVEILCSEEVCNLLAEITFPLCWENKASKRTKPRFFGSLKQMVNFLHKLYDGLDEVGHAELKENHLFTFDTGHLLIWRNNPTDPTEVRKRDEEILEYLPQFARKIKVFHFQINDGIKDLHVTPFSSKYLDDKSRTGLTPSIFLENSSKIMQWMEICEANKGIESRHIHLEAGTHPYDLGQYLEFARQYMKIL